EGTFRFDGSRHLSLTCFVRPTLLERDVQALVSLLDPSGKHGVALTIGRGGELMLAVSDGSQASMLASGIAVASGRWTLVGASLDLEAQRCAFFARDLPGRGQARQRESSLALPHLPSL